MAQGNRTYHDDNEVEPAPRVREILLETQRQPFDQHLQKEYHGEYSVHVVENIL